MMIIIVTKQNIIFIVLTLKYQCVKIKLEV